MQRAGTINPATIVDLKRLPELRRIEVRDDHVTVGGCVTMAEIGTLDRTGIGALVDGAGFVGGRQTRARATLAGNVARSSPAGDTLAPLLVLDAVARVAASTHGGRDIPLSGFFAGPGRNRLEPGELITEIVVPSTGSSAYLRLTYRSWMDLAVSGVAVWIRRDGDEVAEARVALCGVGPTPLLVPAAGAALAGAEPDIAAASAALESAARPVTDIRGTAEYRLASLGPLLARALRTAISRSRER